MTPNQKSQKRHNAFYTGRTKQGKRWLAAKRSSKAKHFGYSLKNKGA